MASPTPSIDPNVFRPAFQRSDPTAVLANAPKGLGRGGKIALIVIASLVAAVSLGVIIHVVIKRVRKQKEQPREESGDDNAEVGGSTQQRDDTSRGDNGHGTPSNPIISRKESSDNDTPSEHIISRKESSDNDTVPF